MDGSYTTKGEDGFTHSGEVNNVSPWIPRNWRNRFQTNALWECQTHSVGKPVLIMCYAIMK